MRNELRNRIFLAVCLAGAFVIAACSDKKGGTASSSSTPNPMEAVLGSWTLDMNHADHSERIKRNFGGVTLTKSTITLKSSDGFEETEGYSNPSVHGCAMTIRIKGSVVALMPHGDRMTMVWNEEAINFVRDASKPAAAPPSNTSMTGDEGRRRGWTSEASMNLRKLFDSAVSYFYEEQATRSGEILPMQFPVTAEFPPHDLWHKMVCPAVGQPAKYMPRRDDWQDATWQALNFAISDPWRFKYEFISKGTRKGSAFTARATGDLDCDGVFSTFERIGFVDADYNISGGAGLFVDKELE